MASSPGTTLVRALTVRDLALFIVLTVFGVRGLATAAKLGPAMVPLWVLAIAAFFIPLGLAVTELGTRDPGDGGFYRWTRQAFGDVHGFQAGWFYWLCNVMYLPTLLVTLAANSGYVIGRPGLGDGPWYVAGMSLAVLWFATWANIRGWHLGRWITTAGGSAVILAGVVIIALGVFAATRFGTATMWTWSAARSGLSDWRTLGYFGTVSFALCGSELAGVIAGEVQEPRRTIPRALLQASIMVAVLYVAGSVALLIIMPADAISPLTGSMMAVQSVAARAGWTFLPMVTAALFMASLVGSVFAWLGGVARLPFAAGLDRFVPDALGRTHPRYGTPHISILAQSVVISLIIILTQLGSTVHEAFLVMLDMTIFLNFIPYLYIFLSLPALRPDHDEPGVVRIPGGHAGLWYVVIGGAATTIITIIAAIIPTPDVGNVLIYESKMWGGLIVFGAAGYFVYRRFAGRAAHN